MNFGNHRFHTISALVALCSPAILYAQHKSSRPPQSVTLEEYRKIDGTDNNANNPDWGAANSLLVRRVVDAYADGIEEASGTDRPNPREISNAVCDQSEDASNPLGASDFFWQWGQFLDHDITLVPTVDPSEPLDIHIPLGDPYFDPFSTGSQFMNLDRSLFEYDENGVRQQVNEITAYIDASNVYGSDEERANDLRTLDGTGKLRTSDGDLLPYNTSSLPNAPSESPTFFIAGDFRANEQIGLTAMHTLFVREHNYWAEHISQRDPELDGDSIYELARAVVAAEMQIITYHEFLPILLGQRSLSPYRGYNEDINAGITNVFATAGYRFGHSMLSSDLLRLDENGEEIEEGNIALADAFFAPEEIEATGIEPLLRGLASQLAQDVDPLIIDDVRNFLFGPPGAGGFDLAALNIQRGRDHGLPSYNEVRAAYGLNPVTTFEDINPDEGVIERLSSVYNNVDTIDAWVGCLAEPNLPNALVGETAFQIFKEQFENLRDGDRFWYQNYLPRPLIRLVEQQTLAGIIRRNTTIGREIQESVMLLANAPKIRTSNPERPKRPSRTEQRKR